MNLTKKAALFGAATLAALGLAAGSAMAQAPTIWTYGPATVVTDSTGTYWQLAPGAGQSAFLLIGADNSTPGNTTPGNVNLAPSQMTNLSFTYTAPGTDAASPYLDYFDTSGASSPQQFLGGQRWTAIVPGFTGKNDATISTTNNFVGSSVGVKNYGFAGSPDNGTQYADFPTFGATTYGDGSQTYGDISQIMLEVDGSSFSNRVLDIYSINLNGVNYAAPTPEPASWAAFAFMGLGAAALMFKAKKRKALSA